MIFHPSAKDKSASQTPAECVKVFHNLANVLKKKHRSLNAFSMSVYVSVSCFHERVCANTSSPLLSNMLFRCLHHIVGMMDRPYNLHTSLYQKAKKHPPAAWSPSTHSRDRIPVRSAGMSKFSSGCCSLVQQLCEGDLSGCFD